MLHMNYISDLIILALLCERNQIKIHVVRVERDERMHTPSDPGEEIIRRAGAMVNGERLSPVELQESAIDNGEAHKVKVDYLVELRGCSLPLLRKSAVRIANRLVRLNHLGKIVGRGPAPGELY